MFYISVTHPKGHYCLFNVLCHDLNWLSYYPYIYRGYFGRPLVTVWVLLRSRIPCNQRSFYIRHPLWWLLFSTGTIIGNTLKDGLQKAGLLFYICARTHFSCIVHPWFPRLNPTPHMGNKMGFIKIWYNVVDLYCRY